MHGALRWSTPSRSGSACCRKWTWRSSRRLWTLRQEAVSGSPTVVPWNATASFTNPDGEFQVTRREFAWDALPMMSVDAQLAWSLANLSCMMLASVGLCSSLFSDPDLWFHCIRSARRRQNSRNTAHTHIFSTDIISKAPQESVSFPIIMPAHPVSAEELEEECADLERILGEQEHDIAPWQPCSEAL